LDYYAKYFIGSIFKAAITYIGYQDSGHNILYEQRKKVYRRRKAFKRIAKVAIGFDV